MVTRDRCDADAVREQSVPLGAPLEIERFRWDRLDGAVNDGVALLALTIGERAIILGQLEDPPDGLAELRAVLMNEHRGGKARGSTPNARSAACQPVSSIRACGSEVRDGLTGRRIYLAASGN